MNPARFFNSADIVPANAFNGHTDYGIGLGLRVPHYGHILARKPDCAWFEIISEAFMVDGGRPLQVLDAILEQYRVVQHGVSLYFGSADKPDRTHLKKLKTLVRRTNTPWLSDHLCWGSVDGTYSHDLLPMPYTFAAAKRTAEKIRMVRDYLEVPICVENVSSYTEFHQSEMTEWEFLTEVVERADCGILLDVNNIYVSSKNHGFDPYTYLDAVPHHRVGQMHIAGHTKESDAVYISLSSSLQPDGTGINLRGANGQQPLESGSIGIFISAYSSSLLDFGKAVYDLEMVNGIMLRD